MPISIPFILSMIATAAAGYFGALAVWWVFAQ
jgi:hypothetical protein